MNVQRRSEAVTAGAEHLTQHWRFCHCLWVFAFKPGFKHCLDKANFHVSMRPGFHSEAATAPVTLVRVASEPRPSLPAQFNTRDVPLRGRSRDRGHHTRTAS